MENKNLLNRQSIRETCYAHIRFLDRDVLGYVRDITQQGAKIVFLDLVNLSFEENMKVEIIPIPETGLSSFNVFMKFHWMRKEEPFFVYGVSFTIEMKDMEKNLTALVEYFKNTVPRGKDFAILQN